jgi:hypothetical protein
METVAYIKTDDNKIINEKCIRWVRKMSDCLEVCTRSNGCEMSVFSDSKDTHKICKKTSSESYDKLNKYFE